jgi:hypothetical protein
MFPSTISTDVLLDGWNQVSRHNFDRHLAGRMEPIYHRWPSNKSIHQTNPSLTDPDGWNRSIVDGHQTNPSLTYPDGLSLDEFVLDGWNQVSRHNLDGRLAGRMEPMYRWWPSNKSIVDWPRWLVSWRIRLRSLTPMACLSTNSSVFSVLCLEYSTISPTNPSLTGLDGLSLDKFVQLLFEWLILDSKYVCF